jgi:hypothetical protein
MNSNGSPDLSTDNSDAVVTSKPARSFSPWLGILVSIIAVGAALLIASQVVGILYSIIFPPLPPTPSNLTEISHKSEDYGIDEWVYGTTQDSCEIIAFYQTQEGVCRIAPTGCAGIQDSSSSGDFVGQCSGEMTFSIFAMRWQVDVWGGNEEGSPTQLSVKREVFWSGQLPQASSDFGLSESNAINDN